MLRQSAAMCGLFLTLLLAEAARGGSDAQFRFAAPVDQQLSLPAAVQVRLSLPDAFEPTSLRVLLDGTEVGSGLTVEDGVLSGAIANVPLGTHLLRAEVTVLRDAVPTPIDTEVEFETISLLNPDECEVLNQVDCLLPYPSSRFLAPADTPTGFRLQFPASGMPVQNGARLSPDPYLVADGFSPTVQILMHFPGGVDPAQSGASRLLPETRTHDLRSLDADSPTVLLDADSGERILHFIEADARTADPARQILFLRPSRSLRPGGRYIVAARNLRHADGSPVTAEVAFAALRDSRPTDIAGIEMRRAAFADIFDRLAQAGVARESLVLAFDFVVQSDEALTSQMLSMRDQSFEWLNGALAGTEPFFTVDNVQEFDCTMPGAFEWRRVTGTYKVPLFLTLDPVADATTPGFMRVDGDGTPVSEGFTNPEYTIAVPCAVLRVVGDCNGDAAVGVEELVTGVGIALEVTQLSACPAFDASRDGAVTVDEVVRAVDAALGGAAGSPKPAAVLGHGLFMTGSSFVPLVSLALGPLLELQDLDPIELIGGGTDWRGLSGQDLGFIGSVLVDLNKIAALPDRLRQGQLNALVLGRLMKSGGFNRHAAFQTPSGLGVFATPTDELYYFGISLGGIMGLMHAALSPDIVAAGIDEGAINFSLLLQRSTQAVAFEEVYEGTGIVDPLHIALLTGLAHELWVRGESAGYATHITSDPLPGSSAKKILMTVAWLDQQVSNQASEITARTLGLANLQPGSLVSGLPEIPDQSGPLTSAYIVYDTATFSLADPGPWIPPLANLIPQSSPCDPHGDRRPTIPASLQQISNFFRVGGRIENYCNGACDAGEAFEIPLGGPCDPSP
jgi:hypothetical protein